MATKEEIRARAKEIIKADPTAGKNRVNAILRIEYGAGLRSDTLLKLKAEVARDNPKLAPDLYRTGGVSPQLRTIYKGWKDAGFLPFEARELTIGHGTPFDAQTVFDSIPAQLAREFRMKIIQEQLKMKWDAKRIRENILDFYRRSKSSSPWEHIRAEYKPRLKKDFLTYKTLANKRKIRAKAKQNRLLRGKK